MVFVLYSWRKGAANCIHVLCIHVLRMHMFVVVCSFTEKGKYERYISIYMSDRCITVYVYSAYRYLELF